MLAISTFRPSAECAPDYLRNQQRAIASWLPFESVVMLGKEDAQLRQHKRMRFIPIEPFPRLRDVVPMCAATPGWSCIINSDIVVAPNFLLAEQALSRMGATCTTSWRWTFEGEDTSRIYRVPNDFGIDFFAAQNGVWNTIAGYVPAALRLGCQRWDSWLLGAFNRFGGDRFFGITRFRCILHPKHDGRKYGYEIPVVQEAGLSWLKREL